MYLKSIELYGFKSFADRTKIELNDNITCVVGPNGSGKSNITDAIRWTLGEQSYSALRGAKMLDIIFSGTSSRRALGMAEVILTFDNSTNFLDMDYSEVEVKRKLYKNGDSEYYINNSPCRLKDIRELFMDTGIGRDGYSIISQGKIDEILSSKPIERRVIFEEASGISKYKSQKNEVERKLKRTNENLVRISDLLVEIKSQRDILKEEAKVAQKYNDLYKEVKDAEISKSYEEILNLTQSDKDLKIQYDALEKEKSQVSEEILKLSNDYEKIKAKLDDIDLEITKLQGENIENIRKEKDLTNKIDINKEKIESRKDDIKDLEVRIEIKEEEISKRKIELEESKIEIKKYNVEKTTYEELLSENNDSISYLNGRLVDLEEKSSTINNKILESDEQFSKNQVRKDTLLLLNEEREETLKRLRTQFERLENNSKEVLDSLTNISNKIKELECEILETSELISNEEIVKEDIKNKISDIENNRRKQIELINGKSARLSILINMEESYEGYNRSIRDFFRLIKKRSLNIPELHDTVANLIKVNEEYEKAITTALGGNTQNLVVDTFSSAQNIIEFLKKEKLGRITFLPLDNIKNYKKKPQINQPGFINYASNLIKYEDKYKEIFEFLLGNIAVVDNLDNGKKIANSTDRSLRIVTLDGDVINPGGSVSGGYFNASGNIFNRKNELSRLKKEIDEHKKNISQLERDLSEVSELLIDNEGTIRDLNEKISNFNENINKLRSREMELKLSNDNNKNNISEYENQVFTLKKQIKETLEIINSLDQNNESIQENSKHLIKDLESVKNDILLLEGDKEKLRETLTMNNLNLANIDSEIGFVNKTIQRLEEELAKDNNEILNLKANKEKYAEEVNSLIFENSNIEKTLEDLISINESYGSNNKKLADSRRIIMDSYNTISTEINDNKGKVLDLEKEIYFISSKLENSQIKVESLISDIQESYYFTMEPDIIILEDYKTKITKSSIKKLKQEISNLGTVNLSSISGYKEAEERYTFTKDQHEDLIETEKSLKNLLREIEITMEEKFTESFKEINNNFNRIFKFLFNGGNAELALEERESFEESGVEIIAQLPGKKRQLLDAMSGGERSLTTVALLFALLETRPAPFCLLDEVDAALDESNIKRFLSYLKNLSNIQFAIITHRKTTMTAADYLYGVTMEEPGVSKVISLKFKEREEENVQMA